ncbi:MAG TPA: hypothetical protein VM328_10840 [Fimbriimonadaceae bacterium]|nr:hypothetical protein [Fimbriimonadaceae bacterium]
MKEAWDSYYPTDPRSLQMKRAQELGVAFVDLDRITPPISALVAISAAQGSRYNVVPLKRKSTVIYVAVSQLRSSLDDLEREIGLKVVQVLAVPAEVEKALDQGKWWKRA